MADIPVVTEETLDLNMKEFYLMVDQKKHPMAKYPEKPEKPMTAAEAKKKRAALIKTMAYKVSSSSSDSLLIGSTSRTRRRHNRFHDSTSGSVDESKSSSTESSSSVSTEDSYSGSTDGSSSGSSSGSWSSSGSGSSYSTSSSSTDGAGKNRHGHRRGSWDSLDSDFFCDKFYRPGKLPRDHVRANAVDVLRKPPKIPIPREAFNRNGETHLLCDSGMSRKYVFGPNFGKIPKYLQRIKEQIQNDKRVLECFFPTGDPRKRNLDGRTCCQHDLLKEIGGNYPMQQTYTPMMNGMNPWTMFESHVCGVNFPYQYCPPNVATQCQQPLWDFQPQHQNPQCDCSSNQHAEQICCTSSIPNQKKQSNCDPSKQYQEQQCCQPKLLEQNCCGSAKKYQKWNPSTRYEPESDFSTVSEPEPCDIHIMEKARCKKKKDKKPKQPQRCKSKDVQPKCDQPTVFSLGIPTCCRRRSRKRKNRNSKSKSKSSTSGT